MSPKAYDVDVTRDGRWWLISVPEIDQLTQARRLKDVHEMAAELVALHTDLPVSMVQQIHIRSIMVFGEDYAEYAGQIQAVRMAAELAAEVSKRDTKSFIRHASNLMSVRDIAYLLDVSPARVSQLRRGR